MVVWNLSFVCGTRQPLVKWRTDAVICPIDYDSMVNCLKIVLLVRGVSAVRQELTKGKKSCT